MSDEYFDADGNPVEIESPNVKQMREQIKTLEAEAAAAKQLAEENTNLKRDGALRDAGLDLDAKKRKALEAAHDGDWTPDALKATAVDLGWAEPHVDTPIIEQQNHQAIQNAQTGAGTQLPDRDAELDAKLDAAKNPEEFMAIYAQTGRRIAD